MGFGVNIDVLLARLTESRAGYLDNINQVGLLQVTAARAALLDQITAARMVELDAANLPADAVVSRAGRLVFFSDVQATAVLPGGADDIALPDVTIPALVIPTGASIKRVLAAMAWRKQVNSDSSANAVNGAQIIQVRDSTPGTWRTAINVATGALSTAGSATEGGSFLVGDNDIKLEVDEAATYNFQWAQALVTATDLTLHDVQTFLIVEFG